MPDTTLPRIPLRASPGVGQVIADRYRLLAKVGEGGMASVYRAEHILMKKTVALKLLHAQLGNVEQVVARFEREAQSASRLSHPNIVQVHDFGRTPEGLLFLVMEFLTGESLGESLARSKRMPVVRALEIMRHVLSALEHAHAAGVIHRDLKPDNIMLVGGDGADQRDLVKLLDFGIAKITEDEPLQAGRPLTQAGIIFGTPQYMSPEQANGQAADHRSDLYSCGIILYEMLTGRRPFDGESPLRILSMHLNEQPMPPREAAPDVEMSVELEKVLLRVLAKNREERIQSAAELRQALEQSAPAGAARPKSSPIEITTRLADGAEVARTSTVTLTLDLEALRAWWRSFWSDRARRNRVFVLLGALGLAGLSVVAFRRAPHRAPMVTAIPSPPPPPPKPIVPPPIDPLALAEQALGRGDIVAARAILSRQLIERSHSAKVHYLLGTIDFMQKDPENGLDGYRQAIALDANYRSDPVLLRDLRSLLDDDRREPLALAFLIQNVGQPAGDILAAVASGERRTEARHAAMSACEKLGCAGKVDVVESTILDLRQATLCEERRDAVVKLGELKDRRALASLQQLRKPTRGARRLDPNACLKSELLRAIEALSEQ